MIIYYLVYTYNSTIIGHLSNIKGKQMINLMTTMVKTFLLLLLNWLLHVLTLETFARGTTAFPRTMALAVFFQTMTFLAFTFCSFLTCSYQEQLLLISATYTFTVISTRQALFKALTIIFLTASFATKTSSHWSLRVCTCLCRSIRFFELGCIHTFYILLRDWGRFVVIADGALFDEGRLGDKLFNQVLIFFILLKTINHNHDLFFLLHRFNSLLLHRHDINK